MAPKPSNPEAKLLTGLDYINSTAMETVNIRITGRRAFRKEISLSHDTRVGLGIEAVPHPLSSTQCLSAESSKIQARQDGTQRAVRIQTPLNAP